MLQQWQYRIADLQLTLAQRRFELALDDLVGKYRTDQARAPRGRPEGGQWVNDGVQNDGRVRTALAAVLIGERVGLGDAGLVRHCIYVDMLGRPRTVEVNAMVPCRPTIPAAPL